MTVRHQGLELKDKATRIVMTGTQGQANKDCNDWTAPRTETQGQGNKDCNDWNSRTGQEVL